MTEGQKKATLRLIAESAAGVVVAPFAGVGTAPFTALALRSSSAWIAASLFASSATAFGSTILAAVWGAVSTGADAVMVVGAEAVTGAAGTTSAADLVPVPRVR